MNGVLEQMLLDNEDITARGVVRKGVFKNATDITRDEARRSLLQQYQARQAVLRIIMEKADKHSKTNLSAQIAKKDEQIAVLIRQREILIASHRAMILAVGELGGMSAWRKFYEQYQDIVDEMRKLDAMPTAEILEFTARRETARDR